MSLRAQWERFKYPFLCNHLLHTTYPSKKKKRTRRRKRRRRRILTLHELVLADSNTDERDALHRLAAQHPLLRGSGLQQHFPDRQKDSILEQGRRQQTANSHSTYLKKGTNPS
jgi:hypothetical protein